MNTRKATYGKAVEGFDVSIAPDIRIAFGRRCTFATNKTGATKYRASEGAVKELEKAGGWKCRIVSVMLDNQLTVVTFDEADALGLDETPAEWNEVE